MKGEDVVLQQLQKALTMEFTAVHQYLLHSHVLKDWGLEALGDAMTEEMEEELGHANKLMERMLFLEGNPDMTSMNKVDRSQTLKDMFEADLRDEHEARKFYTQAANTCQEAGDLVSRDLFTDLVHDEEGHIDWLETQLGLIDRLGEQGYTQLQVGNANEAEDDD
ncbi:MAG: bacterioferritin [Dichotomicrobium sp.]